MGKSRKKSLKKSLQKNLKKSLQKNLKKNLQKSLKKKNKKKKYSGLKTLAKAGIAGLTGYKLASKVRNKIIERRRNERDRIVRENLQNVLEEIDRELEDLNNPIRIFIDHINNMNRNQINLIKRIYNAGMAAEIINACEEGDIEFLRNQTRIYLDNGNLPEFYIFLPMFAINGGHDDILIFLSNIRDLEHRRININSQLDNIISLYDKLINNPESSILHSVTGIPTPATPFVVSKTCVVIYPRFIELHMLALV